MASDKKEDGASAPTRIREVRPAGRPVAPAENAISAPAATASAGASAPTMIKGFSSAAADQAVSEKEVAGFDPVVGWLVIIDGPGRGKCANIYSGMNSLGRSAGQRIRIDFGDEAISGEGAAFITFEPKRRTFHINHGGKTNIVYLNEEAVLAPVPLAGGSMIAIGDTKFRFVQLCGPDFTWEDTK